MSISSSTFNILGSVFTVHNALGPGLLEKPYRNALAIELRKQGAFVQVEKRFPVFYEQELVGEYFADLVVNGSIIIEVKATKAFSDAHVAQLINYLKISGLKLGFLVNFYGSKAVWRRVVT